MKLDAGDKIELAIKNNVWKGVVYNVDWDLDSKIKMISIYWEEDKVIMSYPMLSIQYPFWRKING